MIMLPKLAIIIYDQLNDRDRINFQVSLLLNTQAFERSFFFFGHDENFNSYVFDFERQDNSTNFKNNILSLLYDSNDYD